MGINPNKLIARFLLLAFMLIMALMLISCGSKKEISEHSSRERDSVATKVLRVTDTAFKERTIEKTPPIFYNTVIERPCDENGNLNPVNTSFGSGGNSFSIISKDGQLHISQKFDSIQNVYEKDYRARWEKDSTSLVNSLKSESVKKKDVIRYKYPWWMWPLLILGALLGLLWIQERFNVVARVRKMIFNI